MMKVYFDCNVLLDFVLRRDPFFTNATLLISLVNQQVIKGFISPLTMANVYYTARKEHGKKYALEFAKQCQQLFQFCDNSGTALQDAIDKHYKDFEDDIHFFSVVHSDITIIVTRNTKDFPLHDAVSVFTPDKLLSDLGY